MIRRSLVYGCMIAAGLLVSTNVAQANPYCHPGYGHHGYRGGYVGFGVGYAPRPVYVAPPVVYAPPPVYPPPAYVAPAPYYGYAPYPAAGIGVNTRNFGLWLGR